MKKQIIFYRPLLILLTLLLILITACKNVDEEPDANTVNSTTSDSQSADTSTNYEWSQQAFLKAANGGAEDNFGDDVAISGDLVVVRAPGEDSNSKTINDTGTDDGNADSSGAVYVYRKTGSSWVQEAYLKASNSSDGLAFGKVATNGTYIVVGAGNEKNNSATINDDNSQPTTDNDGLSSSGAVYVFKKVGENWVQDAYLKASNRAADYSFGSSVAISGDTIVIGSSGEDYIYSGIVNTDNSHDGTPDDHQLISDNSGAVYVFKRQSNGDWIQDAYIKPSNNSREFHFGEAVAIDGDTIVVGASEEKSNHTGIINTNATADTDTSSESTGAAYVFKKDNSGNWYQDAYLKASNAQADDSFGGSVDVSGNIIVVGAYGEDSNSPTIINTDDSPGGTDVSIDPPYGAAYVFKADSNGDWVQDAYLKASNAPYAFGWSVSISNSIIAIGSMYEGSNSTDIINTDGLADSDTSAMGAGAVYLFKKDSVGSWFQDAYLKTSNAEEMDMFGYSVAIDGSTIVAGATQEDDSEENSGAVYVYKGE